MAADHLTKLLRLYKEQMHHVWSVEEVIGDQDKLWGPVLDKLPTLIMDYAGVPKDDFDMDIGTGNCRDYWWEALHRFAEGRITLKTVRAVLLKKGD